MPSITEGTLRQIDALNNWLGDVFGEETDFSTILINAGFIDSEIERLKQAYLSDFLQAVQNLLDGYTNTSIEVRNQKVMVQHYGLVDGSPQNFYIIGNSVGVCGERIRQLVTMRLNFYRDPIQQAKFTDDLISIGRRILDNEGNNQQ